MVTLGIDPGVRGAIATFHGVDLIGLHDMPLDEHGLVCPVRLCEILTRLGAEEAWLEAVGPRPTDGVSQAFAFGRTYGVIRATLALGPVPSVRLVTPSAWVQSLGLNGSTKGDRKALCERTWPEAFGKRRRGDHADAALIGSFGVGQRISRVDGNLTAS